MKIKVIKTIHGRHKIVDADDDNAPLITFHNEYNDPKIIEKVLKVLSYCSCIGCGSPIDVDYCTTCRKDWQT